jgi:exonuclease SbcC
MKPLRLSIEGLHSFKERQEIDFELLGETGLFGIFGNTGSGKSTILDAITLALYGAVFRAASRTQGILNSQRDKLEVSFSFTIGVGAGRKVFRTERGFKRHKEKRDSVVATVCRLIELRPDGAAVIAENTAEVTRKIEAIIGLNMEDFTRSVVLPQGEFSQFLRLKDSDRVRMLERIFALFDYGSKLNEKVKKERERLAVELELVERSIREQGDVSAELLLALQQELAEKETEQNGVIAAAGRIDQEYTENSAVWQLQNELEQLRKGESLHSETHSRMQQQKEVLAKAEVAAAIHPYLENLMKAEADLAASAAELETVLGVCREEAANNEGLKAEYGKVEALYRKNQPELIAKRTEVQGILALETELEARERERQQLWAEQTATTRTLAEVQTRLTGGETAKSAKEAQRERLNAEIAGLTADAVYKEQVYRGLELEKEVTRLGGEHRKVAAEIKEQTGRGEELEQERQRQAAVGADLAGQLERLQGKMERHRHGKPGGFDDYAQKSRELQRLETGAAQLTAAAADLQTAGVELAQVRQSWEPVKQTAAGLEKALQEQERKLGCAEERLRRLRTELRALEEQSLATRLALTLEEQQACPVCGSTEHPRPAAAMDSGLLTAKNIEIAGNEELITQIRQEMERLKREYYQNQAQAETCKVRQDNLEERMAEMRRRITVLRRELPPENREQSPEELKAVLRSSQEELERLRQAIGVWEELERNGQAEFAQLKEAQLTAAQELQQTLSRLESVRNSLAKSDQAFQNVSLELTGKQRDLRELGEKLQLESFETEQNRILANERRLEELRNEVTRLTGEIAASDRDLDRCKSEKDQLGLKLQEVQTMLANCAREIAERSAKIKAVAGEKKPRQLLADIDVYLDKLTQKFEYLKLRLETSQTELQRLSNQSAEARQKQDLCREGAEQAARIFHQKLEEKGFLSGPELRDALRSPAEMAELKLRITEYEDTGKRFRHQIDNITGKLAGRTVTAEQWEEARRNKERIYQERERLIGEIARLGTTLTDLENRLRKAEQYRKERREIQNRKSMADEIFQLMKGDAFVAYIAEEHMRYILRDASRRLEMLTGGRYLLQMDEAKDFVVADNTNGGIVRPVATLSGGETFLVALSLALALSGKLQLNGRNPLEFFFLDEGFGTLDPQLLEVVMDSLERLRQENLTIGVISHVPELRNRLSRRLIVTPATAGGAGSRVRLEKA